MTPIFHLVEADGYRRHVNCKLRVREVVRNTRGVHNLGDGVENPICALPTFWSF